MMERYFALKLIGEYIAIGFVVIVVIVIISKAVVYDIRLSRKIKLLEKNGFEKYLRGVPSVGNGAFYGWKREFDGKRITDDDIKCQPYKELKEWVGEET